MHVQKNDSLTHLFPGAEIALGPSSRQRAHELHASFAELGENRIVPRNADRETIRMSKSFVDHFSTAAASNSATALTYNQSEARQLFQSNYTHLGIFITGQREN